MDNDLGWGVYYKPKTLYLKRRKIENAHAHGTQNLWRNTTADRWMMSLMPVKNVLVVRREGKMML